MNKKYFLVIIFSLFVIGCSSSVETEKKEENLRYKDVPEKTIKNVEAEERNYISNSKISSIEKINFDLDSKGKPVNNEKLSTQKYNTRGFLTETITYDLDGNVKSKFNYEYDKNGRKTKTTRFSNDEMINYYTYEYNEFGNKSKAYRYDPSGNLEEYYLYEYDSDGNLVEEKWFSPDGKKVYSIENEYGNGELIQSNTYNENGDLIYEYVFKYDDKGNVVEEIKYNDDGEQAGIIQYIYKHF